MFEKLKEVFKPKQKSEFETELEKSYKAERIRLAPELGKKQAQIEINAGLEQFKQQKKEDPSKSIKKKDWKKGIQQWGKIFEESAKEQRDSFNFGNIEPPPLKVDFGKETKKTKKEEPISLFSSKI